MTYGTEEHAKALAAARERRYKDHLDRITFRVTLASTIIALLAAMAAFWSGWEAHKTRVDDERPFLAVSLGPSTPSDPAAPYPPLAPFLRLRVVNFGKSPAIHLQVTCVLFFQKATQVGPWSPDEHYTNIDLPFVLPNQGIDFGCGAHPPVPENPKFAVPVEMGVVRYQGAEQTGYQTPFCFTDQAITNEAPNMHLEAIITNSCFQQMNLPSLR